MNHSPAPSAPLRDHQPDILFQGDGLARGLVRNANRVALLTRLIRAETESIARNTDPSYKGASRVWIAQAQAARREALASERAYRGLIAERDELERVAG